MIRSCSSRPSRLRERKRLSEIQEKTRTRLSICPRFEANGESTRIWKKECSSIVQRLLPVHCLLFVVDYQGTNGKDGKRRGFLCNLHSFLVSSMMKDEKRSLVF